MGWKKVLIASINTTGIIYGHTSLPQPHASTLLSLATQNLLSSLPPSSEPTSSILWTLLYTRFHHVPTSQTNLHRQTNERSTTSPPSASSSPSVPTSTNAPTANESTIHPSDSQIITLPSPPPGLAIDDSVLKSVREAWAQINGGDDGTFLLFEERADLGEAAEEDDEMAEETSVTTPIEDKDRTGEKLISGSN